ncbi:MAG: DUF4293 family protein [Crocinitomicaceae bacterium]|nr:DUF4293 family protein [Crocinitomicaceae bacterium]
MLQRIQTIYLILIIAGLFIASFTSIGIYTFSESGVDVSAIVGGQGVSFELVVDGEVQDLSKEISELEKANRAQLVNPDTLKKMKEGIPIPLYISFMLLICLNIWIIMSYKKLKRQLALARFNTILCFLMVVLTIVGFSMGKPIGARILHVEDLASQISITTGLGAGFFGIMVCLPFALLAQLSIKRDLKLIQSIDRIR